MEPTEGLPYFQSCKVVQAGEIVQVVDAGCYVRALDGTNHLRAFQPGMTARFTPRPGDFWVVYADGYQAISPRSAFVDGYRACAKPPAPLQTPPRPG